MGNDASVALRNHGCPHIGAWPSVHGVLPAPAITRDWGIGHGEGGNDAGVALRNHGGPHVRPWAAMHGVLPAPAFLRPRLLAPYSLFPIPRLCPSRLGPLSLVVLPLQDPAGDEAVHRLAGGEPGLVQPRGSLDEAGFD